jgi:DNA-binding Xre family transcriptional regulator
MEALDMIRVIKINLVKLLKEKGYGEMPYRELARQMDVDHVSLWKLINGKKYNPSLDMLDKICGFLRCQPGNILEHKKK